MWETPFDPSMLDAREGVVILCPDEDRATELMELLNAHKVQWNGGDCSKAANLWEIYGSETCYRVKNKDMGYASKDFYEMRSERYRNCIKFTFFGTITPDFDAATDDEILSLLAPAFDT